MNTCRQYLGRLILSGVTLGRLILSGVTLGSLILSGVTLGLKENKS